MKTPLLVLALVLAFAGCRQAAPRDPHPLGGGGHRASHVRRIVITFQK